MTISDNISAIEAVEKAMEGVTRGDWYLAGKLTIRHTSVVGGPDGWIGKVNWRNGEANAAYIAACNPVAMSSILAEARKAEALKREIAELRRIGGGMANVLHHWKQQDTMRASDRKLMESLQEQWDAATSARTLLNGGSDAQG